MGDVKSIVPIVGWGLVGHTGTNLLPGMMTRFGVPVPDKTTNPAMHFGVKFLTAIGLGWLAGMVMGKHTGRLVMAGGVLNASAEVVNDFALAPMGLSTYLPQVGTYLQDPGVGYDSPGMTVDDYGEHTPVIRLDPERRF